MADRTNRVLTRFLAVLAAVAAFSGTARPVDYDLYLYDEWDNQVGWSHAPTTVDTVDAVYDCCWTIHVDRQSDPHYEGYELYVYVNGLLELHDLRYGWWSYDVPVASGDYVYAELYSRGSSDYDLSLYDEEGLFVDESATAGTETVAGSFVGGTVDWTVWAVEFSDPASDGYWIGIYVNGALCYSGTGVGDTDYLVPMDPWDEIHVDLRSGDSQPPGPSVTVASPDGGEIWFVGTEHDILWSALQVDTVDIYYSTDTGASWDLIAAGVNVLDPEWGCYPWTVPDDPSTDCLVRVLAASSGVWACSEAAFEIRAVTAADSDSDGLSDADELNVHGTDPLDADSDDDDHPDGAEIAGGTDPLDPDSDDDVMTDGWEVLYSLDPLANDASGDEDVDGFTNIEEFEAGSDPQDGGSVPLADLYGAGAEFSPRLVVPDDTIFSVSVVVENGGYVDSGDFSVDFYVSDDSVITDADYLLESVPVSSIVPGGQSTVEWSGPFAPDPVLPEGDYWVWVGCIVDAADDVTEKDEGNNTAYAAGYHLRVANLAYLRGGCSAPGAGGGLASLPWILLAAWLAGSRRRAAAAGEAA